MRRSSGNQTTDAEPLDAESADAEPIDTESADAGSSEWR
jgi:hypothetical protein